MLSNKFRTLKGGKKLCGAISAATRLKRDSSTNSDNLLRCPYPDLDIPKVSFPEYVWKNVDKWADKTATVCGITGKSYNYNELYRGSKNLAKALRKKFNLKKGDRAAIFMPNVPDYPIVIFGIVQAGLIVTTINSMYTPEEISRQIVDADAKIVFTLNELYSAAKSSLKLARKEIPIIGIKTKDDQATPQGAVKFEELLEYESDYILEEVPADNVVFLPYSSGTTGLPKGVQLTNFNIISNLCQIRHPENLMEVETTDSYQEVVPVIVPIYHIFGFIVNVLKELTLGCKLVTLPRFQPHTYINVLENHHATILYLAPPLVLFLADNPTVTRDHLSSVRWAMSGAAPLGASDIERLLAKAPKGVGMLQGYGSTEAQTVAMVQYKERDVTPHDSVGYIMPNTVCKLVNIDDPTFTPIGPNQKGEILMKGPQVMKGYHNNPEATKNTFDGDWFRTGDLGHYDEKGHLFVTDRLKELIKVKGFQVPPAELEEMLRNHPDVDDAAVFGISHPQSGEVPRAVLVAKSGKTIDENKIKDFVASKVAKYKRLTGGVVVVDAIPKSPSGKILRRQLKVMFSDHE